MTRETKIGLLVGLAFIIVIGILLSDHFTSTMQPQIAPLVQTHEYVLQSTTTPGAGRATRPDVRVENVQPNRVINTQETARNNHPVQIEVGPGRQNIGTIEVGGNPGTSGRQDQGNSIAQNLNTLVGQVLGQDQDAPLVGMRQYKTEPGDTLYKIAGKMAGKSAASREAFMAAFMKANPSLKDPGKIKAGETYSIPTTESAPTTPTNVFAGGAAPTTRPAGTSTVQYTAKAKDSLWKIAMEQVGSASAVAQIKDLNKDVLKGGETVKPGMKLRLPPKSVASAD
jgi:LysM repeat protein